MSAAETEAVEVKTDDGPERTLVRGDVTRVLLTLPDDYAEAAIVDWPWSFDASNGTGRMKQEDDPAYVTELPYDVTDHEHLSVILYDLKRVVKDGGWLFVFADDEVYPDFRKRVEQSDWTYRRTLIWDRQVIGMGYYHRVQHYPIIAATLGDTDRYVKSRGTVFSVPPIRHAGYGPDWPTAKPPELYERLTAPPVLEPGERLLEPFAGTAPGYLAAVQNSLAYWGCEIEEKPVSIARDRMAQKRLTEAEEE